MSPKDAEVDVLIIGAGAAGVMCALSSAAYGIKTRIIDKRPNRPRAGHGDGTQGRLMEILDTFELANTIIEQGNPFSLTHSWMRNAEGNLTRTEVSLKPWDAPSPYTTVSLSQNRVANYMLEKVSKLSDIEVERSTMPESITVEPEHEYPVKVEVRKNIIMNGFAAPRNDNDIKVDDDESLLKQTLETQEDASVTETIRAKYVIACDGAHSWTRKQLNIPMVGDDTDLIWGVIDIVPKTDFPSARVVNMLLSEDGGLMWIPRERNMIRIYTVMGAASTDKDGNLIRSSVNPEMILNAARKIMHPYKLESLYCDWWAAYQIGQRCATSNTDPSGRIFLAGDAVHTHSPQAGQGLNVSMADAYNLMWKIGLVTKGVASPKLLDTYSDERLVLGQRLVDFDRQFAAIVAGRAPPETPNNVASIEIERKKLSNASALIFHGLQVIYPPGLLVSASPDIMADAKPYLDDGKLPPGIVVGMRMPIFHVRRHASGFLTLFSDAFKSNGSFKIIVFSGDISKPAHWQCYQRLAWEISALQKLYTPSGKSLDSVIDAVTLHTADPKELNLLDLPEIFRPFNSEKGLDYNKVFYDEDDIVDTWGIHYGSAYQKYNVSPDIGRMVVLRPDGYIAYQGDLGAFDPVKSFFSAFMVPQSARS